MRGLSCATSRLRGVGGDEGRAPASGRGGDGDEDDAGGDGDEVSDHVEFERSRTWLVHGINTWGGDDAGDEGG